MKGAVHSFTKILAKEVGPHGITVELGVENSAVVASLPLRMRQRALALIRSRAVTDSATGTSDAAFPRPWGGMFP